MPDFFLIQIVANNSAYGYSGAITDCVRNAFKTIWQKCSPDSKLIIF